jgi:hypothetical protein
MSYIPGSARFGDPTPQTDPDLFTTDEIRAEYRYLVSLDKRYGPHPLRALARVRLHSVLISRRS